MSAIEEWAFNLTTINARQQPVGLYREHLLYRLVIVANEPLQYEFLNRSAWWP